MVQPDLKTQIVDGEAVLLDRANERVHQLDGVGAFILGCCVGWLAFGSWSASYILSAETHGATAQL